MKNKISAPFVAGIIIFLIGCIATEKAEAQEGLKVEDKSFTQTVLIHPVIETADGELIFSREHTYKEHLGLGDQLARDFVVVASNDEEGIHFNKNDGKENQDYISWRKNVQAPVSGKVILISHPYTTNTPGKMNRNAEPGRIYIKNEEGVTVTLVHVREIEVEKDQQVEAGQVVAKVGNNGNSTLPHVHAGAWKDDTPLQIQVDLYAEERFGEETESVTK